MPAWFSARYPAIFFLLAVLISCSTVVFAATAPPNDTCTGAEVIPSAGPFPYLSGVAADVSGATTVGDPPSPACISGSISRSVWYQFTPSATKLYTISTGSDTATTVVDTVMAIYTSASNCGGPFALVACNDDSGGLAAAISKTLNAGTTYYLVVWISGSVAPSAGKTAVQLRVSQPVVPANDTCAGAEIIPGNGPFPYLTSVADTTLATTAGDPPAPSCNTNFSRSVWYRFTPNASAVYELSTCADTATTIYDTLMAVYTSPSGCSGPYTFVVCNDNACGTRAVITATLSAGVTYYIVIWEAGNDPYTPGETSVQMRVSGYFPPAIVTTAATSITSTGAVLNAVVNPNHVLTSGWFEWGTTTNFGNITPVQSLGNGSSNFQMGASIAGIQSAKTYYFRGMATNNLGISQGTNRTFTRSITLPQFTLAAHLTNGAFHSQFSGNAGQSYLIQGSTNLVNWPVLGNATELGGGLFQFDESNPTNLLRFYRVFSP
ncbi:hypothetical protein [Pedosphaera parvula]|nr:hypothetical protein [Pedosphaera parvula]